MVAQATWEAASDDKRYKSTMIECESHKLAPICGYGNNSVITPCILHVHLASDEYDEKRTRASIL